MNNIVKIRNLWTENEVSILIKECELGNTIQSIQEKIPNKSKKQIKTKAHRLNLSYTSVYKIWDEQEISKLKTLRLQCKTVEEISKILNRGYSAIVGKMNEIGIYLPDEITSRRMDDIEVSLIRQRISNGFGYADIAKELNRSRATIERFCHRNMLETPRAAKIKQQNELTREGKRICRMCENIKPIDEFYDSQNRSHCIACLKVYHKNIGIKNNEKIFSLKDFLIFKFNRTLSYCKKKNIEFNITLENLEECFKNQSGKCFYTNIQLKLKLKDNFSLSIDRKCPKKGYTKDNIVLCSWLVNFVKNKVPFDIFVMICKSISENKNLDYIFNKYNNLQESIDISEYKNISLSC